LTNHGRIIAAGVCTNRADFVGELVPGEERDDGACDQGTRMAPFKSFEKEENLTEVPILNKLAVFLVSTRKALAETENNTTHSINPAGYRAHEGILVRFGCPDISQHLKAGRYGL
jgi:hypothetical protein